MFTDTFLSQSSLIPDGISEQKYWTTEDVFEDSIINNITHEFNNHQHHLKPAQISKGLSKSENSQIRNDKNSWLNNGSTEFKPIWHLLDELTSVLKRELFLPLKRYEAQLAHYPPGHFYKRHTDRHKLMPARLITLVLYLSPWEETSEGQLVIYGKETVTIKPKKNSLVMFSSELEHEVLPTKTNRKSISAWFRDDIL